MGRAESGRSALRYGNRRKRINQKPPYGGFFPSRETLVSRTVTGKHGTGNDKRTSPLTRATNLRTPVYRASKWINAPGPVKPDKYQHVVSVMTISYHNAVWSQLGFVDNFPNVIEVGRARLPHFQRESQTDHPLANVGSYLYPIFVQTMPTMNQMCCE